MDFLMYLDKEKSLYCPILNADGSLHLIDGGLDECDEFIEKWLLHEDNPDNFEFRIIPADSGIEYWDDRDYDEYLRELTPLRKQSWHFVNADEVIIKTVYCDTRQQAYDWLKFLYPEYHYFIRIDKGPIVELDPPNISVKQWRKESNHEAA